MVHAMPAARRPKPFVLSVLGLKHSGKTSLCSALIASLRARGYIVGALKSSREQYLGLDRRGSDSARLADSGVSHLVVRAGRETLTLQRHRRRKTLSELIASAPQELQFLVCEGGPAQEADAVVLCLASPGRLEETIRRRGAPRERIVALSGSMAAGGQSVGAPWPVLDALRPRQRERLTSLLLRMAGRPKPTGSPGGPLAADPHRRPGGGSSA
jgi:molybdopterin-guanine dinucleotide biosynthesis protein MobB